MKKSFRVYLKAGERLFVNGAVLRVDRKVAIEFLNDVSFLLEGHVMQADRTTTPLRQLYFVMQMVIMDSGQAEEAKRLQEQMHEQLLATFRAPEILAGLHASRKLMSDGRYYEALRTVRQLFAVEDQIISPSPDAEPGAIAV